MENKDLNKRVLERLKQKIAIEEFKKENKQEKNNQRNSNALLKVASLVLVASLVAGNAYTYATYDTNIFSYALDKLGIFSNKENVVKINEEKQDTNASLTLESYALDQKTLLIGYRLKFNEKPEYFLEYLTEDTKIIDGENVYGLNKSISSSFYKISDLEYEIFKLYEIDINKLTENATLKTDIILYKDLDGPIEDVLGKWNFEFKLDKSKVDSNYEEYLIENKNTILEKLITDEDTANIDEKVSLIGLKQSNLATKLTFEIEGYFTDVEYFIEIVDENENKILEDNIQKIYGGYPSDIIIGKIDLNSKIRINIYEKGYTQTSNDKKILSKGSIEVDLSKDLKEKEKRNIEYATKVWKDLTLKYDNIATVNEYDYVSITGLKNYSLSFEFFDMIGDVKTKPEHVSIVCMNNLYDKELKETAEDIRKLQYAGYNIFDTEYTEYLDDVDGSSRDEVILTHEELIRLVDEKEIIVNGITLNENNIHFQDIEYADVKETKIDNINAITWKEYYGESTTNKYVMIIDENVYTISIPSSLEYKDIFEQFLNDIKVNR